MDRRHTIADVDAHESSLVAAFAKHVVLSQLDQITDDRFWNILLQRRFLSLAFTPLYDMTIDGIDDIACKTDLRRILREEYRSEPHEQSHREDLVDDMIAIGITKKDIRSTAPTPETRETITGLFDLLRQDVSNALFPIKLMSTIRIASEVLVAKEYELMWPRLEQMGLDRHKVDTTPNNKTVSKFYAPHWSHDAPQNLLVKLHCAEKHHHPDIIGLWLLNAIDHAPAEGIEYCMAIETLASTIKTKFFDQFR